MSAAGWYPDPDPTAPAGRTRYWDGQSWTDRTSDEGTGGSGAPVGLTKQTGTASTGAEQSGPEQTGPVAPGAGQTEGWAAQGGYPSQGYGPAGQAPQGYGPQGPPPQGYGPQGYGPAGPGAPVKPTHLPDGTALASVWKRLAAAIIDSAVFGLMSLALLVAVVAVLGGIGAGLGYLFGRGEGANAGFVIASVFGYIIGFIGGFALYYWYYLHRVRQYGATFAKQWLGMRIRVWHLDGQLTWGQVLCRDLVPYLINSATGGLFGLVDALWCLWDPHRQCLHDKFAGTVVIDTEVASLGPGSEQAQLGQAFPPAPGWMANGPEGAVPPVGYPG